MLENGLIEEVKNIYEKYGKELITSIQAIGYKEVIEYLEGRYSKEKMIEKIKMETRRYAKRQITWFKKIDNIIWLDSTKGIKENVDTIIEKSEI